MAQSLEISPKHISMTGSARLGYSLGSDFGRAFNDTSDLDIFIVDGALFNDLAIDARHFAKRFIDGDAKPSNDTERNYWVWTTDNIEDFIVKKRFIQHSFLPSFDRYPTVQGISRSISRFKQTAQRQSRQYSDRKVSVRVYEDWEAATGQIGGSMVAALARSGFSVTSGPQSG